MRAFIERIDLYPEKQKDGNWIRNMVFNFPVPVNGQEVTELPLESGTMLESVVRLERDGSRKTEQGNRASLGAEGEIDFADIALLNAELKQRGLRYHIYYKDEHTACLEPPGACCLTEDLKQNTMQCIREYYEKEASFGPFLWRGPVLHLRGIARRLNREGEAPQDARCLPAGRTSDERRNFSLPSEKQLSNAA